jgi:hypothetical protein
MGRFPHPRLLAPWIFGIGNKNKIKKNKIGSIRT